MITSNVYSQLYYYHIIWYDVTLIFVLLNVAAYVILLINMEIVNQNIHDTASDCHIV